MSEETSTRGGALLPVPAEDPLTAAAPDDGAGRQFAGPPGDPDRYELLGSGIGGGEGTVWRAQYHGTLRAPLRLAVKALRRPPGAGPHWPPERERRRWQDQTALLRHTQPEHVVRVYETFLGAPPHPAGGADPATLELVYLVMEWVDGPTLGELLRGRPATAATVEQRLRYVAEAGQALTALASSNQSAGNPSLHRDLKPGNCIIHDQRGLVLIDLSTLRPVDDGYDPDGLHTPGYTAPEVLRAPQLPRSPAADSYSLGALAVFCLTGAPPHPPTVGSARTDGPPLSDGPPSTVGPPPSDGPLRTAAAVLARSREIGVADPPALVAHILTALDEDPARRPADLAAWSRTLVTLTASGRNRGSWARRRAVLAAAVLIAVGSTGSVALADGWPAGPGSQAAPVPAGSAPSAGPVGDPAAGPVSDPTAGPVGEPTAGPVGTITSPVDGATVPQCSYFSGTSRLPAGMTLILAMRNLSNGSPIRYAETVFGWEHPEQLATWRGNQFFGRGDGSVGQRYQVDLVVIPVAEAVRLDEALRTRTPRDYGDTVARAGITLASVQLRRVGGAGPGDCPEP